MLGLPLGRLVGGLRRFTPVLSCFLMALLGTVPHGLPQFQTVTPDLAMMTVFYWSIYRPDLLPKWSVIPIGLFEDLLSGGLIGLNAVVLLLVHYVGLSQRRAFIGKPFVIAWTGFMLVAISAGLVFWAVLSVMSGTLVVARSVLFQYVLTIALFPVMTWVLVRAHRYVVG
ncbi:MAG: rod shape-determining protein MreD [Alphaproteobacteria bacterium]|nr:rod shape-determining protein MreD [Alphaproteobacteria bacterium]